MSFSGGNPARSRVEQEEVDQIARLGAGQDACQLGGAKILEELQPNPLHRVRRSDVGNALVDNIHLHLALAQANTRAHVRARITDDGDLGTACLGDVVDGPDQGSHILGAVTEEIDILREPVTQMSAAQGRAACQVCRHHVLARSDERQDLVRDDSGESNPYTDIRRLPGGPRKVGQRKQVGPHRAALAEVANQPRPQSANVGRSDEEPHVPGVRFAQERSHPVGSLFPIAGAEVAAKLANRGVRPPQEVRPRLVAEQIGRSGGQERHRQERYHAAWAEWPVFLAPPPGARPRLARASCCRPGWVTKEAAWPCRRP